MRGKGFTLIELLVTISILSILMTIALISYGSVQKNARDGKRKSDISIIQSALEQYHSDQGFYPTSGEVLPGIAISLGSKTYLNKVPVDPTTGASYSYSPSSASVTPRGACDTATRCINYCLYATLENNSNAVAAPLCDSSNSQYQVQAP